MEKCTNCLRQYKKDEKCSQCRKALGAEFVCVKIQSKSAHFCSKKCADKIAVAASYRKDAPEAEESPQGYECKKCGYRWSPGESEAVPKLCPECANPNLTVWKTGATQNKS